MKNRILINTELEEPKRLVKYSNKIYKFYVIHQVHLNYKKNFNKKKH